GRTVRQEVLGDGLLHLNVAHILLVPKNRQHTTGNPLFPVDRGLAQLIEFFRDFVSGLPADKPLEDVPDDFRLLRVDDPLAVRPRVVAQHPLEVELGLRSEEHTSELQSRFDLVCRLLLEKKKKDNSTAMM